jgi:endonuclease YncB( thermonuclease family)
MKGGAKWGAALGAAGALAAGMAKNRKQRKENNFYNDRLAYAQRQAKRREKADWKQNMTGREGYTY